jgi:hypothetical protein
MDHALEAVSRRDSREPVPFCLQLATTGKVSFQPGCQAFYNRFPDEGKCGLQNLSDDGKWNPKVIESHPETAAVELLYFLGKYGCKTLVLDIESISGADRKRLTSWVQVFVGSLKAKLNDLYVSVAVHAKLDSEGTWDGARSQDWPKLCESADELLVMAYDKNMPGITPPGEVAPQDWVKEVLGYGLSVCPASKLRLGMAAYGYDWSNGQTLFEAKPGPLVFFESSESRNLKIKLAESLGIHKFFVWSF